MNGVTGEGITVFVRKSKGGKRAMAKKMSEEIS